VNGVQRDPEEKSRGEGLQAIADQDDVAFVVTVGHVPGGQRKQDAGKKESKPGIAQAQGRLGDLVDLPGHGKRLRLRTQNDEQTSRLIQAEVT
jgi:hypothetical protein